MLNGVKRGDVFFADLSPVQGCEQGGIRPVLVIQNDIGNRFSPTVIIAAITAQIQKAKLPTHIEVSKKYGFDRDSVILMEQVRTLDKGRLQEKITHLPDEIMEKADKAALISLGLVNNKNSSNENEELRRAKMEIQRLKRKMELEGILV